jgi:sugar phosphate isomerase/epimerase
MKAITVRLDGGGLESLLKRVRVAQELGFEKFDLCISNPQVPLGRIVLALNEHHVGVAALRLKEDRHSAMVPRKPGYAKLGSFDPAISSRSAEMVIETADQLAPARPQFLVIEGGYVQAPQLNERQFQLDELLDCGDCEASPEELAAIVKIDPAAAEKQTENFCRGLHKVARAIAPVQICLLPPESPFGLLQPERMQHVFDDLKTVGYWHCTSHVAILRKLGGPDGRDWVQRFGTRLKGVYLEDMLGSHGEQAPGLGEIDFQQLAPELAQSTVRVMVVDDDKGTKLRFGSDYLAKVGIF